MVRDRDMLRQSVRPLLHDLVVAVEDVLAVLRGQPPDDHVQSRRAAHEPGELQCVRRIAELRHRDLVRRRPRHVGADEVVGAHRRAVVLVAPVVGLRELPGPHVLRQVHAQLLAHQAAVHDVVRIVVRLQDGLQEVLAFVQMFGHAPFLEADDGDVRVEPARFLQLQDVDGAAVLFGVRAARERIGDASHVHVLQIAVEPHEVEDDVPHARIANLSEFGVARAGILVPQRVEDEFAAVDARARQPFDLAEEFRRQPLDELAAVDLGRARHARQNRAHGVAPGEILHVFVPQVGRQGHAPFAVDLVRRPPELLVRQAVDVEAADGFGDFDRRGRREDFRLRVAHAVAAREKRDDLPDLRAEFRRGQLGDFGVAADGEEARAGVAVVVVDAPVVDGDVRIENQPLHVLLRNRLPRHTPVFAARAQGVAHFRRVRVEIADAPLGDGLLQLLVRLERQIHAFRVGADVDVLVGHDQIDRILQLRRDLLGREFRQAFGGAFGVQRIDPQQALRRVHAPNGDKPGRPEEEGPDAAQQPSLGILGEQFFS